jgi:hypothetical protein
MQRHRTADETSHKIILYPTSNYEQLVSLVEIEIAFCANFSLLSQRGL